MTTAEMKSVLAATPFLPFTLHTADGSTTYVPSREMAILSGGGRMLFVQTGEISCELIDLLLVSKLSFQSGQASPRAASPAKK